MGELLHYYALFYVLGLFMMALFIRLYWSRKKYDDAEKINKTGLNLVCTPGNDVESTTGLAGSGCNIDVTLVDASGNIFSLFKTKTIATITTTELLTNPLVMEESEILKVQASDANELHVIASILEIQPREVT